MQLLLVRHLWGVSDPWQEAFGRFAAFGYQAVEAGLPPAEEAQRFADLLAEHDLRFVPQLLLPLDRRRPDVEAHVETFARAVEQAAAWDPLVITCHAAHDGWSIDQAEAFYRRAVEIADAAGVTVAHETHRGRFFFSPWNTRDLLERVEGVKLCVDFSHWVCATERLIDDLGDIIQQAASRAAHVHTRVGYEEGPQVPDPRVEAYRPHLQAHERWWDVVWDAQAAAGVEVSTLAPEFGPPPYLHTHPATGEPAADLQAVCDWMAQRQKDRFAKRFG